MNRPSLRRMLGAALALLALTACAGIKPSPPSDGVDPVLTWDAVTTNCVGEALTGPVTYNVYAVSGAGPIPTVPSADESPCGVVQLATGNPINTAPITAPPYHAIVADGQWTFAVEAVLPSGARSGISNQVTRQVRNRGGALTSVRVQ